MQTIKFFPNFFFGSTLLCFMSFLGTAIIPIAKVEAQGEATFSCPETEFVFSGESQPTLCDENPNFTCSIEIGAGTQYPRSSLIGNSISGNVCIVGDFEVDRPFTFQTSIVKINSNVTINVKGGLVVGQPTTLLHIDNSKLFACNGLWKGIRLEQFARISTSNLSEIEDAELAIYASAFSQLNIYQTTFNRNRVGIELINSNPLSIFSNGPFVFNFHSNRFTCDAPLNGTTNEITYAGVKLKDVILYTFQSYAPNIFTGIQNGIYVEGAYSYLGLQNLVFRGIKNYGIFMEVGNLDLRASSFNNCERIGVYIGKSSNSSITQNCVFTWNEDIPLPPPNNFKSYTGIFVESLNLGSLLKIAGNSFLCDFTSTSRRINAAEIIGITSNGGAQALINQNNSFKIHGNSGNAIGVYGSFPSTSHIDIVNNEFDIRSQPLPGSTMNGIYSNGDVFDFDVIGNLFFNYPPNSVGITNGMTFQGSDGFDNQISDNFFEPWRFHYTGIIDGVQIQSFNNAKICSNTFYSPNRALYALGINMNTDYSENIIYGGGIIVLHENAIIEEQMHKGNMWTIENQLIWDPNVAFIINPQAFCAGPPQFSEFIVHTPQSTGYFGQDYNPYHPVDINPDNSDEWWSVETGNPSSGCVDELGNPGNEDTNLKRAIADGSIDAQLDSSIVWQSERSLFFAIKRNPTLLNVHSIYRDFMANKSGSNIEKFYHVFFALDSLRNGNQINVAIAQNNRIVIDSVLLQIETMDQAWQNTNANWETLISDTLQQKINQLKFLLQQAEILQDTHINYRQTGLAEIEQFNNAIVPSGDWEIFEKTVNSIFINYLQNGNLTVADKQQLEIISNTCPTYGGMSVFKARSIIPKCSWPLNWNDNQSNCLPLIPPFSIDSIQFEEPRTSNTSEINDYNNYKVEVFPNPSKETITVIIPEGLQGEVELISSLGSIVKRLDLTSSRTILDLRDSPTGVYFAFFQLDNGHHECLKVIISK